MFYHIGTDNKFVDTKCQREQSNLLQTKIFFVFTSSKSVIYIINHSFIASPDSLV